MSLEMKNNRDIRMIALFTSLSLLFGIYAGQFSAGLVASRFSNYRYAEVVRGTVYIDTPSQIEICPPYPDDDRTLSSFIITDGKTNGYALGESEINEKGLEPYSYKCSYTLEFPIEVSPTGKYSLIFSSGTDIESSLSGEFEFNGILGDNAFIPEGSGIEPSAVLWFLTTVCPGTQLICADQ